MNSDPDPTGLQEPSASSTGTTPRNRKTLGLVLGWIFVCAALLLGGIAIRRVSSRPLTHDAVVKANLAGIAPRVSGPLKKIHVRDNQLVKKGDPLFEIDAEPFEWNVKAAKASLAVVEGEIANARGSIGAQSSKVEAARASLAKAKTALTQATDTYNRLEPLARDKFVTAETLDSARSSRDAAAATVQLAEAELAAATSAVQSDAPLLAKRDATAAQLAQAELALRDCIVSAPIDGQVVGLRESEGSFAAAGHTVLSLINLADWHVEANFLESDLRRIQPGDPVRLEIMTDPGRIHTGVVESIGAGVTTLPEAPPSLSSVPVVRRELDWVRLAQRFPVRIRLEPAPPAGVLRIGAVVTASIESKE